MFYCSALKSIESQFDGVDLWHSFGGQTWPRQSAPRTVRDWKQIVPRYANVYYGTSIRSWNENSIRGTNWPILQVFVRPLYQSLDNRVPIIGNKNDLDTLFSNIEDVGTLSSALVAAIKDYIDNKQDVTFKSVFLGAVCTVIRHIISFYGKY